MLCAVDGGPVGQVVVVGVAVVGEAALFDQQFAGVDAGAVAAVPPDRTLAGGLLDRRDRSADVVPLLLAGQQYDVFPAVPVGHHVVAAPTDLLGSVPVALKGNRARVERGLHVELVEDRQQPPEPHSRAILIEGFQRQIPFAGWPARLCALLTSRVAVTDRALGAFLIVDHQRDCYPGSTRPGHLGWFPVVPHDVATGSSNGVVDSGHTNLSDGLGRRIQALGAEPETNKASRLLVRWA